MVAAPCEPFTGHEHGLFVTSTCNTLCASLSWSDYSGTDDLFFWFNNQTLRTRPSSGVEEKSVINRRYEYGYVELEC